MFGFIKKLFGAKPVETVAEAPYKVEAKVEAVNAQPVADKAVEAVVKSIAPAKKPAAKKPAAKKQGIQKPKGPRKPKAPKVAK